MIVCIDYIYRIGDFLDEYPNVDEFHWLNDKLGGNIHRLFLDPDTNDSSSHAVGEPIPRIHHIWMALKHRETSYALRHLFV